MEGAVVAVHSESDGELRGEEAEVLHGGSPELVL